MSLTFELIGGGKELGPVLLSDDAVGCIEDGPDAGDCLLGGERSSVGSERMLANDMGSAARVGFCSQIIISVIRANEHFKKFRGMAHSFLWR